MINEFLFLRFLKLATELIIQYAKGPSLGDQARLLLKDIDELISLHITKPKR